MENPMRLTLLPKFLVALVVVGTISGCGTDQSAQNGANNTSNGTSTDRVATLTLPAGTSIDVALATSISSETANVGDIWTGSIPSAVVVDGRTLIPAGSSATGTVKGVRPAQKGDRAMLDVGLSSITVGDHRYDVHGSTEAVIAGSTRARNLGAIAGSAAAGALIGKAVSGTGKGAVVGGVIGGGAATGVVSQTKGYQVVLKEGTAITFTTDEVVAVRP